MLNFGPDNRIYVFIFYFSQSNIRYFDPAIRYFGPDYRISVFFWSLVIRE